VKLPRVSKYESLISIISLNQRVATVHLCPTGIDFFGVIRVEGRYVGVNA
jgi:hypothetical protein